MRGSVVSQVQTPSASAGGFFHYPCEPVDLAVYSSIHLHQSLVLPTGQEMLRRGVFVQPTFADWKPRLHFLRDIETDFSASPSSPVAQFTLCLHRYRGAQRPHSRRTAGQNARPRLGIAPGECVRCRPRGLVPAQRDRQLCYNRCDSLRIARQRAQERNLGKLQPLSQFLYP